jgi:hypothetical protein
LGRRSGPYSCIRGAGDARRGRVEHRGCGRARRQFLDNGGSDRRVLVCCN